MYDFILEVGHAIWKNGLTLSALGTALYVLLKQRKVKNKIRKYLPWLLSEDGETRQYIANQQRIESKIDALLRKEGIRWEDAGSNGTKTYPSSEKTGSISFSPGALHARFVDKFITYITMKGRWTMEKLKSRKFWLAVVSAALIIANDGLDLGVNNETVMAFAAIVIGWIFGESYIDGKKVKKDDDSIPIESNK